MVVVYWKGRRRDLQARRRGARRLLHLMYLPSESTSLWLFHTWGSSSLHGSAFTLSGGCYWHFCQYRGGWGSFVNGQKAPSLKKKN